MLFWDERMNSRSRKNTERNHVEEKRKRCFPKNKKVILPEKKEVIFVSCLQKQSLRKSKEHLEEKNAGKAAMRLLFHMVSLDVRGEVQSNFLTENV